MTLCSKYTGALTLQNLSAGQNSTIIRISCYDWDSAGENELVGYANFFSRIFENLVCFPYAFAVTTRMPLAQTSSWGMFCFLM